MLTGNLLRARVRGATLTPQLIDATDAALLGQAQALLEVYRLGLSESLTRAEIDAAVRDTIGDTPYPKLLQGIAKVLADRSSFACRSPLPPPDLRKAVFAAASARGPLALEANPFGQPTAAEVLADVAGSLGLDLDGPALGQLLYADRKDQHRIESCEVPDASWLLQRYNVALVQSLLLRASQLVLRLDRPTQPRLRQLFRYVKFNQLIASARKDGATIEVVLDGPLSLFQQSTRYGMQLARFFPAILLQARWSLDATVLWTRAKHAKQLRLDPSHGLVSHFKDRGAYSTREQEWFEERFRALGCDWELSPGRLPIDLGGKALVMPDFSFSHQGRRAHLEIVGYWRRDWLQRRIELLERWGPGNLVLAVSRKLLGSEHALSEFPGVVIPFKSVVPAREVLAAIETCAR